MSKRKILVFFLAVFILAAFLSISVLRRNYLVPIIAYHSVGYNPKPEYALITVSPETFERQMRFLRMHKYNVLPLESLADSIREKKKIPPKTIAITLDDGFENNYTYAFPILKKYNLPATIFLIIDRMGHPGTLTWDEVKEMQSSGIIAIGSHTLDHHRLSKIESEEDLRREIFDSKKILEERLGTTITQLAYPMGDFDAATEKLVSRAGYKLAVATNPGKKHANDDIFALKRLRISENANNLFVFWLETSGYYNFIRENRKNR